MLISALLNGLKRCPLSLQVRDRLSPLPAHPGSRNSMNSWGSAPSSSTVWGTGPQSAPAWPPYKLPSDYLPSSSTSVQQAQCTPRMSLPSVQDLHGARPQVPQHKTLQQNTPQLLLSSSNHAAVMQSALTTTPQHSAAVTYQAPYSVNNQPHGGMPLECYYTAHLQYPKTWVHLWDRLPLREPETLISSVRETAGVCVLAGAIRYGVP